MQPSWPYLTTEVPALPAAIRHRPEDFQVDELPLYDPCGDGDHLYVRVEKAGLSTRRAVQEIARALGIPSHAVGVAGLKDARGLTRQVLSLERVDPARVRALRLPGIAVLEMAPHRSKLRLGALAGNRFTIRLRGADPDRLGDLRAVLEVLGRRGVPNYFGPQRFGLRGDTWEVGRALLQADYQTAVALVVGRPEPRDPELVRRARGLAEAGRFREAAAAWPRGFPDCVRLLRALDRTHGDARRALFSLDRRLLGFYVSAFQAWIFNSVLAERLPALDRLLPGDLVHDHAAGSVFRVVEGEAERSRAARFEISPTGPLVGHGMPEPTGEPAVIEGHVLDRSGAGGMDLPRSGPLRCPGGRRPLRFQAQEVALETGADDIGAYLQLRFRLPPGCYATALLREICKDRLVEGPAEG